MKLLLADDHTLFRDALVQYIERADIAADVAVSKDFYGALQEMKTDPNRDLIILDLRMPGMNGLEGLREMRETYPDIPIAIMSGVAEESDVKAAFDLGAIGYFPKTLSGKALLQAIKLLLTGERFMPMDRKANKIMPSYYSDEEPTSKISPYGGMQEVQAPLVQGNNFMLTPREKEVLTYLAQGDSNKEIANSLGLQVVTVKLHVRGVCQKLNVKNRTQAALKARECNLDKLGQAAAH